MSEETKRWWVAYVVARLAPFANLGGYQYAWESEGNNTSVHTQTVGRIRGHKQGSSMLWPALQKYKITWFDDCT